ncbi:MAG: fumarylacetoacetate hydrolase family protein [Mariniblastus sp.]|nr:fumarylacetoacetate hydrolase family protein [Mariniblastus sp.]
MKLASITYQHQLKIGVIQGIDRCFVLDPERHGIPDNIEAFLASGQAQVTLRELERNGFEGAEDVGLGEVHLNPPLKNINKVICIGKNYADHAREMGGEPPEIPVVFSMFPSAIIGPGDNVVLPRISSQVDYEAELVVVIGKPGRHIARERAMDHVFGYCCGNDISARDWQKGKPGGQWLLGKTFDTFAPLGPFLVTKDEVKDPHQLDVCCRLNGEVMQASNTSSLIFQIDFLISHLSQFITLAPGDLIFTGTPPGVGAGRKPPLFLKPGDTVEVEIESVGVLANPIVAEV